jgi:DNA-binding IclR family transcriptional regulator
MAGGAREQGRSVTSRVLAILDVFDAAHTRLTLSDISRRSGLPLSTVHRLVSELERWRAVESDPDGGYRIGLRLWELGQLAPGRLREVAQPWLQELFEATRDNVHLAVRDGFEVLYLDKIYGPRAVPIVSRVGGRLPMHTTGVGKALLAHQPAPFIQSYLRRPLERPTCYAITEPGRLARELADIRRRGWAVTREEMTLGSCSLAAPVRDREHRVAAAVGIVVSSRRAAELKGLVNPLLTAVARIEDAVASESSQAMETAHFRSAGALA